MTVTGFGVMMTSLTELWVLHRLYEMVLFKTNYQCKKYVTVNLLDLLMLKEKRLKGKGVSVLHTAT